MAQTTGHGTSKHATLEIRASTSATWVDASGWAAAVTPGGGDHMIGDAHVFDGSWPLVALGKLNPLDWTVRVIYTEEDEEGADLLHGFYENQEQIDLRYRPFGASGWQWFITGFVVGPAVPEADGDSGDILTVEATVHGTGLTLTQATT